MRIHAKPMKINAAIVMMAKPRHKTAVRRLLHLNIEQYDSLYKMYQEGRIIYYTGTGGTNKISLKIAREDHPLIQGFIFEGINNETYRLPNMTIQEFGPETVGTYYDQPC